MLLPLNELAARRCDDLLAQAAALRVAVVAREGGTRVIDCGVKSPGGLEAGRTLAEVCLAGLGRVAIASGRPEVWPGACVTIATDHPVAACMASQYAGWAISGEKFFAMGSGPMRAARGKEDLFDDIGCREQPAVAVGVLESGKLPPDSVCCEIAQACGVEPARLTLLVARTASLAGTIQVVARSVETALHKLHELDFDLSRVVSGFGVAPLPPIAADDLAGIGLTNDAVLYGGDVTLWVHGSDDELAAVGPRVPSNSSPDFGQPFREIFQRYDRDFYKIDPLLFSPARITFVNLDTGRTLAFGELRPDVLRRSFAGE